MPGASDEQALANAGDSISANASGLICAINGYPANGVQNCTATSANQYFFWSYWQGNPATNAWTYANVGPASHTVNNGDTYVEGWRYQNPGPASPAATPPSVTPAAFAQACPGVTPVAASSGGAGTGSTGSGSSSDSGSGSGGTSETSTSEPGTSVGASSSGDGTAVSGGSVSGAPGGEPATPTTMVHTGATTTVVSNSTTTSTSIRDGASVAGPSTRKLSAAPAVSRHVGGADPGALPVVIVAIVVAALMGAAVVRWRRKPVEE